MPYHESFAQAAGSAEPQAQPAETILSPEAADKLHRAAEEIGKQALEGADHVPEDNVYQLPEGPVDATALKAAEQEAVAHVEKNTSIAA